MIRNPILPGFHSDPCLCRRGEDYYLACSTFVRSRLRGRHAAPKDGGF